jgi:hypothetical protein
MDLGLWAILMVLGLVAAYLLPIALLALAVWAFVLRMRLVSIALAAAAAASVVVLTYQSSHCAPSATGDFTCVFGPSIMADAIGFPMTLIGSAFIVWRSRRSKREKRHD